MPIAGFAVIPLVPSEPPHLVPTISSAMPMGARGTCAISASVRRTHWRPNATVSFVPPSFWITATSTGRPDRRIAWHRRERLNSSQPSETSSTAPTLGCVHSSSITSWA